VDSCEEARIQSLRLRSKGSCAPFVLDLFSLYIYLIDAAVALASTSTDWGRHRRVQAATLVCRQGECEAVYSFSSSVLQRAILPMNDT
jgi:hypothetical protein